MRVLTGFPNHPEGVLHPDYREKWRRGFVREDHGGVQVSRTWLLPAANQGMWGRAANYSSFALSATLTGPFVAQWQGVVIGTSPQLLVGVAGYLVARSRGLPFVFEVRDLWPQSIVAVGATDQRSTLYRSLEQVANFLYRHADRIVLDGEAKRQQLIGIGVPPEKTAVIRNGVSPDFCFEPGSDTARATRERVRKELGLGRKFIAMYLGTLGMAQGLETILLAADRLKARPEIVFLIIGEGAEREQLLKKKEELCLSNVLFLRKQPRDAIPAYLSAADVCLAPLRKREVFKTAIPSKMFEAMAAGKPVILGVEGEAKQILLESRAGIPVLPEDQAALADGVALLHQNRHLCQQMGLRGRSAVLDRYSRQQQASVYLALLEELTRLPSAYRRQTFSPAFKTSSKTDSKALHPKRS